MIRTSFRSTVSIVALATVLGGCSLFHHHDNYYSKAVESRPLEVPPDLEMPAGPNELVVPPGGNAAPATSSASAVAPVASPSSTLPAVVVPTQTDGGLHVTDSVDHTWQRVGIALERAQVGTISARDESGHSYTLDVQGLRAAAAEPQEHHWYTRILHPFGGGKSGGDAVSGRLNVKVMQDGDGSRVDVQGASNDASSSEAARRVLDALRERLS